MYRCPDCGMENPSDQHTCIQYERNRANEMEHQLSMLYIEIEQLKKRVAELEHGAAGRAPWRTE